MALIGTVIDSTEGLGTLAAAPVGHVAITCSDLGLYFTALLNTAGVRQTGGGARHDISERVKAKAVPEYRGHDPIRLSLSVLLDGYSERRSIESHIDLFQRLARRMPNEPRMPVIRLTGPVPYPDHRWVVDGPIEWDDSPEPIRIQPLQGSPLARQALTLNLLERVSDTVLTESISRGRRQGKGAKKTPVVYTTKRGQDDLGDVSKAVYGNRHRAVEIALFNQISVGTRVRPGMRLRIP